MFNDIIKKLNNSDPNYIPSPIDIEEILSFIGKESELTSKIYKCYEFIQAKFIQSPEIISSMNQMLKMKFGDIIISNNINLRDYSMNMLIGMFFKLEENYEVFLDIYYTNIQRSDFIIDDRNKKYEDNFYYEYLKNTLSPSLGFEANYKRILYAYENIDKKSFVMSNNNTKISLIIQRLFNAYNTQIINFFMVIMCNKIKTSLNKFEIEQERTFFRICYSQWKNEINLIDFVSPAFDPSINITNRKVFLFSILILFNSIGPNNFNQLLDRLIHDVDNKYIDFIQKSDMSIMEEHIAHLYPYLDTSRTFQHCFECIIGDLTTCEEEQSSLDANSHPLTILSNLMLCLELFVSEYKKRNYPLTDLYNAYFEIQLLVIKFFNPYGNSNNKLKDKYNNDFISAVSSISFNEQLKTYESKHPLITSFINSLDVCDTNNNCLLYQNWFTLVYKNFTLYDTYKIIRKFLFKSSEEKGLFNLIKLPTELNKYNTITWKRILESVFEDTQDLSPIEGLDLIVNLKMLFYHEMSLTYPGKNIPFDSITYDYSAIVSFFKNKFDTLVGLFFNSNCSIMGSNNNNNNRANQNEIEEGNYMNIDSAFENFMFGNQTKSASKGNIERESNNAMMTDNNTNQGKKKDDNSIESKTKVEILNIYSLIITSLKMNERITISYSSFALDLIDMLIKQEEASIVLNYITKVISLIIKLDLTNLESKLHPIHLIFNNMIRHLIIKILKDSDNASQYYNFLQLIVTVLKDKDSFRGIKQGIIYAIKQMVYKNVDSQNYRNPTVVKNMIGLNDIDERIVSKRYMIELLFLLSKEEQLIMYGFYIRFLSFGVKEMKLKRYKYDFNIIKLLKMLIEIEWLPKAYARVVNVLSEESFNNKDKFFSHCINYLTDISPLKSNDAQTDNKDIMDKQKTFQIQFRNILFDNANVIKKLN